MPYTSSSYRLRAGGGGGGRESWIVIARRRRLLAVQSAVGSWLVDWMDGWNAPEFDTNGQSAFATVARRSTLADFTGCRRHQSPRPPRSRLPTTRTVIGPVREEGRWGTQTQTQPLARRLGEQAAARMRVISISQARTPRPATNSNNGHGHSNKCPKGPADRARGEARYGYRHLSLAAPRLTEGESQPACDKRGATSCLRGCSAPHARVRLARSGRV